MSSPARGGRGGAPGRAAAAVSSLRGLARGGAPASSWWQLVAVDRGSGFPPQIRCRLAPSGCLAARWGRGAARACALCWWWCGGTLGDSMPRGRGCRRRPRWWQRSCGVPGRCPSAGDSKAQQCACWRQRGSGWQWDNLEDQLSGVERPGTERRLAPALAGAGSDGARGRRLLHEGAVVVPCSSPPFHAPGETLDPGSPDRTLLAACRHVLLEGSVHGGGVSWRDQWRGGGGVVGALYMVTMLELLRKGRKLSSEDAC